MRLCTCLPFCRGSTPKDDPEPPPKEVLKNRRSLESLRPEPVASLTTRNEGLTSGEDEFGIGGVESATGDRQSGLIRAGGMGVIGNISMDHETHKGDEYGGRGRDYGEDHKGGQDMKSISGGNETTVQKRASTREGNNSTHREHEINMEQIINCGEDPDAEKHLKTIRRQQFWKKPFRSVSLRKLVTLKWKGKRPTTDTTSEYPPKVERFSIEDGRISREVTELI